MRTVDQLLERIPAEFVPVAAGGTSTHVFDPAVYDALEPEIRPATPLVPVAIRL